MKRSLQQFALDCGGTLHGADRAYSQVNTDSRTLSPDELFVALRGPNFDGSDFAEAAFAAGAAAVVLDSLPAPARNAATAASTAEGAGVANARTYIVVPDTLSALQRAARAWRQRCSTTVIGVAGSNGKTTVKEMLAAILSLVGPTLATRGNFNNHIGVPLTLLRLSGTEQFAVIEIGANNPGEVQQLARLADPGVGIVTNAGAEHLEGFGSLDGVAQAEGELFAQLAPQGIAIVNQDDPYAALWRGMTTAGVISFGLGVNADVRAQNVHATLDERGFRTQFVMISPLGRSDCELRLAGMHNVVNALGAAAAAIAAGATLDTVQRGLAQMRPVAGRLQWKRSRSGGWIIDDSYNANPSSVQAAIDVLAAVEGRRWLVFGEMGELGEHAITSHRDAGRYARTHRIERLFAMGELTKHAVSEFGDGAQWFGSREALTQAVSAALQPDVRLLIKGSRVNRLERVVDALVEPQRKAG